METPFQRDDIAFTKALINLKISVDAESEQLKAAFLESIKGHENELIETFLAKKAKEVPIGSDKLVVINLEID